MHVIATIVKQVLLYYTHYSKKITLIIICIYVNRVVRRSAQ